MLVYFYTYNSVIVVLGAHVTSPVDARRHDQVVDRHPLLQHQETDVEVEQTVQTHELLLHQELFNLLLHKYTCILHYFRNNISI